MSWLPKDASLERIPYEWGLEDREAHGTMSKLGLFQRYSFKRDIVKSNMKNMKTYDWGIGQR
jgi:hypothetical protein